MAIRRYIEGEDFNSINVILLKLNFRKVLKFIIQISKFLNY